MSIPTITRTSRTSGCAGSRNSTGSGAGSGAGIRARWAGLTALTLAASLTLAACGNDDDGQSADGKPSGELKISSLNLGAPGDDNILNVLVKEFEKKYPDVDVKLSVAPYDTYVQSVPAAVNAGSPPDVMLVNAGYGNAVAVKNLADAGKLLDLSGEPWASNVPEADYALVGVDDKLYELPMLYVIVAAAYDKKVFDELGLQVPTTYTELLDLCATAEDQGKIAVSFGAQSPVNNLFVSYGLSASTVPENDGLDFGEARGSGETTFADSPGWQKTLEQLVEMNEAGCFGPAPAGVSDAAASQAVASGDALMVIKTSEGLPALQALNPEGDWAMFPFPGNSDPAALRMVGSVNGGWAIPAKAKNVAAAKAWLEFMASPDIAARFTEGVGSIDAQAIERGELQLPPALEQLQPLIADGNTTYYFAQWKSAAIQPALMAGSSALLSGQGSPGDVLEAMDTAFDQTS